MEGWEQEGHVVIGAGREDRSRKGEHEQKGRTGAGREDRNRKVMV
jgi:hypothetical protein